MFYKNLSLFIFFICASTNAQYTEVINSNRPGFSQSPYSVGTGVYQFETGFYYSKSDINPLFTKPEVFGMNLFFRTGFFMEKLELSSQITFQKDKVAFQNITTTTYETSGLEKVNIGAKYLLYQQQFKDKSKEIRSWKRKNAFDWLRAIPSVAIYAGVNFDMVNNIHKVNKAAAPVVGVLLQNDLSNRLIVLTNFYYENIATDYSQYKLLFSSTLNISPFLSVFTESETLFNSLEIKTNVGGGFAYLIHKNLQIDIAVKTKVDYNSKGFYAGLGFSYRIDAHQNRF